MMPNDYSREQLARAHRLDLLREAEHERLVAQLPQPERTLPLLFLLLRPWRFLRARLQKRLRRRIA